MKRFFTIAALLFASQSSFSQTYTISPNDTLWVTANFNQLGVYDIYQDNITSDTIDLNWNVLMIDLPSGWDYSMCDLGHCYVGIPGGSMDPLPAAQSAFLGLNINPMSVSGTGTVRVYVYDVNSTSQADTLTWIINTQDVGVEEESLMSFSMYPNPADHMLNIVPGNLSNENYSYEISDISGRIILSGSLNADGKVDVSAVPHGIYIVRISSENTSATKKLIIR
jgi:hypothetical protein